MASPSADFLRTAQECRKALCNPTFSTFGYTRLWRNLSGIEIFTNLDEPIRKALRSVIHGAFTSPRARRVTFDAAYAVMSRRLDTSEERPDHQTVTSILLLLFDAQATATFHRLGVDPRWGSAAVHAFQEARAQIGVSGAPTPESLAWKRAAREAAQVAWTNSVQCAATDTLLGIARDTAPVMAEQYGSLLLSGFLDTLANNIQDDLPASCMMRIAGLPRDMQRRLVQPGLLRRVCLETLRLQPGKIALRSRNDDGSAPDRLCAIALSEAGRDPAVFADPDTFDPWRQGLEKALSFGVGQHACPGKEFAISLAEGLLSALLARGHLCPNTASDLSCVNLDMWLDLDDRER